MHFYFPWSITLSSFQFHSLLIVPLIIQNKVIGTMDFSQYSGEMNLSKKDIERIK